jgi:hypothetical protein
LTGQPEHERQNRTGMIMTGRTGKVEQNGNTEKDRENRTGKTA